MADDEVKVTPEMVRAGKQELSGYSENFTFVEEAVIDIYKAMERARRENLASITASDTYFDNPTLGTRYSTVGQGGGGGSGGTSSFNSVIEERF